VAIVQREPVTVRHPKSGRESSSVPRLAGFEI
jgi:hypothetical protein